MIKFRKSIVFAALAVAAGSVFAQMPDVLKLMKATVIPNSNIVFSVGNKVPKTDAEWAAVQTSAAVLVETAQRLMALGPDNGRDQWGQFVVDFRAAARKAADAAKAHNVDGVTDAGDALFETCEGCHRAHMKK